MYLFWDLKSLTFQAITSSTSGQARHQESTWVSWVIVEADVSAGVVSVDSLFQSGLEPTVEPTGFEPVVVQLNSILDVKY
jgi:hypothetical protein